MRKKPRAIEINSPEDFCRAASRFERGIVEVRNRRTGELIIARGIPAVNSDLCPGHPAILEYGNWGLDNSGNSVIQILKGPAAPDFRITDGSHKHDKSRGSVPMPPAQEWASIKGQREELEKEFRAEFTAWLSRCQMTLIKTDNTAA